MKKCAIKRRKGEQVMKKTMDFGIRDDFGIDKGHLVKIVGGVVVLLIIVGVVSLLTCVVHPKKGEITVLIKKTGKNLTNEMVLAPDSSYKGVQIEKIVFGPAWELRNWYFYDWKTIKAIDIPSMKVGVLIRKYGKPLPPGEVVAKSDDEKGIVEKVVSQSGLNFISTFAYDLEIHDLVKIEPGNAGLVVYLVGKIPGDPNGFVVKKGERGVQPYLLGPGTYPEYSNPYTYDVIPIDTRSQKFDTVGAYSIIFPSEDSFDNEVEATVEWAPILEILPETAVKYVEGKDLKRPGGVIENIQRKLILPFARSYFRTIGGQHNASDFIIGDTKIKVQNEVEARLREECRKEGVEIRALVLSSVKPAEKIKLQYARREIARREIDRFKKEVETEIGNEVIEGGTPKLVPDGKPEVDEYGAQIIIGGTPKLKDPNDPSKGYAREGGKLAKVIQERRKDRETQLGQARQKIAISIRTAEQYSKVEITKAQKDLEVTKRNLKAAQDKAAAVFAKGKAEADVTVMKNKAEAEAVNAKVSAFGLGEKYAEYQLITKISPSIVHILSNTEGVFADLFERFASISAKQQTSSPEQQLKK